jgi:glyoxylase-like metal-dependent hydrolase (beta-lactamase superfamily II)
LLDDHRRPVFGDARHILGRVAWEFWTSDDALRKSPRAELAVARRTLEAIRERLDLVDGGREIVPGFSAIPAPGHTPGHLAVSVRSGYERLLYTADTALHLLHLAHPEWTSTFDLSPQEAVVSRRRIFDLAAEAGALVMGHHLPGLGRVVRSGEGWEWRRFKAP